MELKNENAKKFFASLYATKHVDTDGHFDSMVTSLVAKLGDKVVTGDQALQGLMFNYVLSDPKHAAEGRKISAALAGIKQRSVDAFLKAFPKSDINSLIDAAKTAGYAVDVLKK
ncbi:hypothetical protein SAMN05421820_111172 [Pedobacter steynii]|uniref:Uncharacterized protein n=1 Tax=Pedobacter steynii TaxID=430522 RepID=A0A1H0GKT1_9SPHI|nr:hypothetical protein [Pedobacter steynii]NQX42448.1 hypothetical protein [Pedobacter steynii]SDO07379.1 hypothetical protein SAMN05421820_111172 [Pedobacter steynii]